MKEGSKNRERWDIYIRREGEKERLRGSKIGLEWDIYSGKERTSKKEREGWRKSYRG